MPGFTVTRGLGPGASPTNLIARGFLPELVVEAAKIFRGGRSAASRAVKDLVDSFKISASLVQLNGKELVRPIINTVSQTFTESDYLVKALPLKLQVRKADDVKVNVTKVKVRRKDESN